MNAVVAVWTHDWQLVLSGFLAGLVDSIGGGGGLISVPALLSAGIPLPLLLGTNKCLAAPGTFMAALRYARAGLLPPLALKRWALLVAAAVLASAVGARISQSPWVVGHLRQLVPLALFGVMIFLCKRWFWDERRGRGAARTATPDLSRAGTAGAVAALAGYDGVFGPGAGTFLLSYFEHRGCPTVNANAATKIFNLSSNVGALTFFAIAAKVDWAVGIAVAVSMILGNYAGSGLVLKQGKTLIRVTVLTVTTAMIVKLLRQ